MYTAVSPKRVTSVASEGAVAPVYPTLLTAASFNRCTSVASEGAKTKGGFGASHVPVPDKAKPQSARLCAAR